ncbi:MAG: hypothetical protein J3Q66DRAFT_396445 [Benniella sp.]|nr:MAG: hypothetical protein J3Q66DRAFT_396445 [Benniella sp.]
MTLGTLTGCLRRATDMTEDEITKDRDRLESATVILCTTRVITHKAIELLVLNSVRSQSTAGVEADAVLEMILDKKHGTTIVRNLVALILNGSIDHRGKPTTDPIALQARAIAYVVCLH